MSTALNPLAFPFSPINFTQNPRQNKPKPNTPRRKRDKLILHRRPKSFSKSARSQYQRSGR